MDKYVWHSVRDELPPASSPLLILATERQLRDIEGDIIPGRSIKNIQFGYFAPDYETSAWRDEMDTPVYEGEDFKITHWMFAPNIPEE